MFKPVVQLPDDSDIKEKAQDARHVMFLDKGNKRSK